ncbi:hypothetical protein ACFYPT_29950 [Streptomyces sp. NPDC005529]
MSTLPQELSVEVRACELPGRSPAVLILTQEVCRFDGSCAGEGLG